MSASVHGYSTSVKPSVSRVRRERQKLAVEMQQVELKCLAQRMSSVEVSVQELTSEFSMIKAKDGLAPPPGLDIQSCTSDGVHDAVRHGEDRCS